MNKQQAQEWLKGKGIDPQCMVQNSQGLQKFFNLSKLISEATEVTSLTTEEVRKAAIKVVSENLTGGEFQNDEYEAIKIIDALIEAGHITTQEQRREDKPLTGWISVKDGLPIFNEKVLVYTFADELFIAHRASGIMVTGEWYESFRNLQIRSSITHWQPLPEKPKV